jgi:hypothetical protein
VSRRRELAILGLVLGIAAAIRLWRFDLAEIGFDEAAAASLVMAWKVEGLFPLTGIVSSVGIPNPPAWPYLLAGPLLIWSDPYAMVAQGIAVGVLNVVATWWIGRRWLGAWGGVVAAAYYGTALWIVVLGRSAWQPSFLQLPALLCLDALLLLAVRKRPWALILAAGWLGLMVQLHYIAIAYVFALPVGAWLARAVVRPIHLIAAALVALVPLLPFAVYELHPSVRLGDLSYLLTQAREGTRIDLEAWNLLLTVAGNRGAAGLVGSDVPGITEALGRWFNIGLIGGALLVAGLVAGLAGSLTTRLIVFWTLLPILALLRHTLGIVFHYVWIDFPGVALTVGVLGAWASRRAPVVRIALATALGAYACVSILTLLVVLSHVERVGGRLGHGTPVRFSLAAAEAARALLPAGGEVLIGGPALDTEVLRFALGYATLSRHFDDCDTPPVAQNAIYLLFREGSPAVDSLAAAGAPLLARIERGEEAYLVYGAPSAPPQARQEVEGSMCLPSAHGRSPVG